MNTPVKNNYDTAVSVVGAIFGTAHFIFQSAADLTAHAEGKIVENITKGEIKAADRTEYRKNHTMLKQQEALDKVEAYKAKMRAANAARAQQTIEPSTTM